MTSFLELTDSVTEQPGGESMTLLSETWTGKVNALCLPSFAYLTKPIRLRQVLSTALIHGSCGHIWAVSMTNQVWTNDLACEVDEFLSSRFETWSWHRLECGLSNAIAHAIVLHRNLPQNDLALFKLPLLADAIFSRWLSQQRTLPDADELHHVKAELIRQIQVAMDLAVAKFLSLADPVCKAAAEQGGLHLDLYNYLANTLHQQARLQFAHTFPLLAKFACSTETKSVWRHLRQAVDDLRSPVIFLSQALKVSPSAVRALKGVKPADVGEYFCARPKELFVLLGSIPPDFFPRTPEHWRICQTQYEVGEQVFGRSRIGAVQVKARVAHALRHAVALNRTIEFNAADASRIERLRTGIFQATLSYHEESPPDEMVCRKVAERVDVFLCNLSWSRLLKLSRNFDKNCSVALENCVEAVRLLSGAEYFDFCPNGAPIALPNGYFAKCLSSAAELAAHGAKLGNCLDSPGYRGVYHDQCVRGLAAIFGIFDKSGTPTSTAEFRISGVAMKGEAIRFQLVQHTGPENGDVDQATSDALDALRAAFSSPAWQARARKGVTLRSLRGIFARQASVKSVALFLTSLEAFRATFKGRADGLLQVFSREPLAPVEQSTRDEFSQTQRSSKSPKAI